MPELPEVEVTRLSFADRIAGARIQAARTGLPLRWPLGIAPESLAGRTVLRVRRRGKYLLLDLDFGLLLLHLGMSGSVRFAPGLPPSGRHDHFDLDTDLGTLRLNDPRRFGAVVYADDEASPAAVRLLGRLGVEPLDADYNFSEFATALRRRNTSIKQALLAGAIVVGVGNIYASEALFAARIRPTTRASRIGPARARRLFDAIRMVLASAVAQGGSTLRDFSNAEGVPGYFQLTAMVYGREGLPCKVCGTRIRAFRQGQRSTFHCPQCQR